MTRACAFCAIASGTAPASIVWRDDRLVGFLDIRPLFIGHVLIAPTRHVATYDQLDPDLVGHLAATTHRMERAVTEACGADGSMLLVNNVVSQSVPHLHQHVIPRRKGDGLRIWLGPRQRYDSAADQEETAARIRRALDDVAGDEDQSSMEDDDQPSME
jgi:histidine triad (HIT) family protein